MPKLLFPLLFIGLLLGTSAFIITLWQTKSPLANKTPVSFSANLANFITELQKAQEIITPEPLRMPYAPTGATLTTNGILLATNKQRATENIPPVSFNSTLSLAAQKKVDDMFTRQYFAHEAPDGTGPADLVNSVGYAYLRVGENLALGNFASDADLVQAWMDSPGHRANIMSDKFTALGLAVGQGMFEGDRVWLAVQTFAAPASLCPSPKTDDQTNFEQQKNQLEQINRQITEQEQKLTDLQIALDDIVSNTKLLADQGNAAIKQGNEAIQTGNEIYQTTKDKAQAQPYWDKGAALQTEGKQLIDQAKQQQTAYTAKSKEYDETRADFNALVEQQHQLSESLEQLMKTLNRQIRTFNECLEQ